MTPEIDEGFDTLDAALVALAAHGLDPEAVEKRMERWIKSEILAFKGTPEDAPVWVALQIKNGRARVAEEVKNILANKGTLDGLSADEVSRVQSLKGRVNV